MDTKIPDVFNFGQNFVRNLKRPKFLVINVIEKSNNALSRICHYVFDNLLHIYNLHQEDIHFQVLETFPVHNRRTRFIVFLFGDPHLLEGGEGSQDGSSDPDGIFPLRRCNDLDLVSE